MSLKASKKLREIAVTASLGVLAVALIITAVKDGEKTGASTLPQAAVDSMFASAPDDFNPADAMPKAVRAIVDKDGQCLRILTRTGHLRACEDQPDWKSLPTEVDTGQFFRGTSLD